MNQTGQVKEWSNATPAGLVALAIASFGFFAVLTGKVSGEAIPLLGLWLLGGFAIQIVVAILDLKSGNSAGGNTFLFFSAYFMLVSGLEMVFEQYMKSGLDKRIDGWAWLALMIVIYLWTPAYFKNPLFMTLIVLALDVALPFIALQKLGILGPDVLKISGWALLVAGICAIYLAAAMIVNTAYGKKIYPNPGPLVK